MEHAISEHSIKGKQFSGYKYLPFNVAYFTPFLFCSLFAQKLNEKKSLMLYAVVFIAVYYYETLFVWI